MIARNPESTVRCGIYTRVSTAGQAEGDFSSIDNQREAAEAYIRTKAEMGWTAALTHYDDAGWSGSNIERPALRQLLGDAESGRLDMVIVYKIDRLSRSLLDFARLTDRLDRTGVGLVSVTQQFDTSSSMGRLTLNMLLSFAQFEREMIAERTRDKVVAARRRGKWTGGLIPLGYDLVDGKLQVNEAEAVRVRQIFALYLEHRMLTSVVAETHRRGWRTKSWLTKAGTLRQGRSFSADSLRRLLTSPVPIGRTSVGKESSEGEHDAIVDAEVWEQVQDLLAENVNDGGRQSRNRSGALLKGLLRCAHCDTAMTPTHTKRGTRRYAYYVCVTAQKKGWASCPSKSVAAHVIEAAVVEQIRQIAQRPELIEATVEAAVREHEQHAQRLRVDLLAMQAELARLAAEEGRLAAAIGQGGRVAEVTGARLAEIEQERRRAHTQAGQLEDELAVLAAGAPDPVWLRRTLASFEPVWEALEPVERAHLARLLISEVVYDGRDESLEIGLRADGVAADVEVA